MPAIHSPQRSRSRFTRASLTRDPAENHFWSGAFRDRTSVRARASSIALRSAAAFRRAGPSSLAPFQAPTLIPIAAASPSQAPISRDTSTGGAGESSRITVTTSAIAAGRITSDVVATDRAVRRVRPTANAAAIAISAVTSRMTSFRAIVSQALALTAPTEYHGRKSAMIIRTPEAPASQSPQLSCRRSTRGSLTDRCASFGCLETGRLDRVHEQHRDRHRAHAARHGRDRGGLLHNGVEVDVAHEAVVGAIDADVDHHRPFPNHLGGHDLPTPDGSDQYVGAAAHLSQVARARVTHRHGRIACEQQRGKRSPNQLRAAEHDRFRAPQLDAIRIEQLDDAGRRAGHEALAVLDEAPGVRSREAVDVLERIDQRDHRVGIDVTGQRQLQQDAADRVVLTQLANQVRELVLRHARLELVVDRGDADLFAGLALVAHVHVRGRVVADEDRGEPWLGLHLGDLGAHAFAYLCGDGLAVDDPGAHFLFSGA